MKTTSNKLLNEEAVKNMLDCAIRQNKLMELPTLLMCQVAEEYGLIVSRYQSARSAARGSVLPLYAGLHPTDEQLRRALDRLLSLPATHGRKTYAFKAASQWLAVEKVLIYLGIISTGHGRHSCMEQKIAELYVGDSPRIACRQDDISKKDRDYMFDKDLAQWERIGQDKILSDYWYLSISLLQFIKQECVNEFRSADDTSEVISEAKEM